MHAQSNIVRIYVIPCVTVVLPDACAVVVVVSATVVVTWSVVVVVGGCGVVALVETDVLFAAVACNLIVTIADKYVGLIGEVFSEEVGIVGIFVVEGVFGKEVGIVSYVAVEDVLRTARNSVINVQIPTPRP